MSLRLLIFAAALWGLFWSVVALLSDLIMLIAYDYLEERVPDKVRRFWG